MEKVESVVTGAYNSQDQDWFDENRWKRVHPKKKLMGTRRTGQWSRPPMRQAVRQEGEGGERGVHTSFRSPIPSRNPLNVIDDNDVGNNGLNLKKK